MPVAVWEDGIDIRTELRPLYKYRSMEGQYGKVAIEDAIIHNRLFWQNPLNFNDPFDCQPVWQMTETPRQRARRIERATFEELPGTTRKFRRGFRKFVEQKSRELTQASLNQFHNEQTNTWAVTCFSLRRDSLLMWSHYADSHKGVCLVFNEILVPRFFVAFKVYYSDMRPICPEVGKDGMEEFKKSVLTKGSDWSYEQECRLMDYSAPAGFRSFPQEALRAVILGARISDDDATFVRKLVESRRNKIAILKSTIDEERFRVTIAPETVGAHRDGAT